MAKFLGATGLAALIAQIKKALAGKAATSHTHSNYVPTTRKVNNKVLSADISLTASDVGAAATSHTHSYAGSASAGGAAKSVANSLTIQSISGNITYNGSSSLSIFPGNEAMLNLLRALKWENKLTFYGPTTVYDAQTGTHTSGAIYYLNGIGDAAASGYIGAGFYTKKESGAGQFYCIALGSNFS